MAKPTQIRQGGSLPFSFDLGGASLIGRTCTIYVKQFIKDTSTISREIPLDTDGLAFSGFLTSAETAGLKPGLWHIFADMPNVTTQEDRQVVTASIRFEVGQTVVDGGPITPFVPTDLSSLVLWMDAEEEVVLKGVDVEVWGDQSSSTNNAFQTVAAERPFFTNSGIAGKPSVIFDNLNDEDMIIADDPSIRLAGSLTAYFVLNANVGNFAVFPTIISKNSSQNYRIIFSDNGSLRFIVTGPEGPFTFLSPIPVTENTDLLLELNAEITIGGAINFTSSGTSLGSVVSTLSAITTSTAVMEVATNVGLPDQRFGGKMSQVLLFNEALSTVNRNNVGNYLANRYPSVFEWNTIV